MSQASNGHSAGNGNGTTGVRQSFVDEFDEFEGLITSLMPLLKEYYYENGRPDDTPVVSFLKPSELAEVRSVIRYHPHTCGWDVTMLRWSDSATMGRDLLTCGDGVA
eukprot:m.41195 g.41195  ORF g.41195 m.41195 type:complete len:107 (+) comp6096_c0_seq1:61-381(+)